MKIFPVVFAALFTVLFCGCEAPSVLDESEWPEVVTPEHEEKVKQVKTGLFRAQAYYDIADYDSAEREFQKVLAIDPYNLGAKSGIDMAKRAKGMGQSRGTSPYGY